ncbi:hypothetical protein PJP10_31905, partial [Mycobacterium kansasii]
SGRLCVWMDLRSLGLDGCECDEIYCITGVYQEDCVFGWIDGCECECDEIFCITGVYQEDCVFGWIYVFG